MMWEIMIYLIDHMYEYGDQLWCGTFFNMDLQRESDIIGFKIGDLITETDLRERSLTRLLTEN